VIPSRYTLLFLLLVGIPLLLIGWLGIMLVGQQRERSQKQFAALVEERLTTQQRLMNDVIRQLESEFDRLLTDTQLDETSLYLLPGKQPLVRHAFLLNARQKLVWPPINTHPESEAAAFRRRAESVWESGFRTSQNDEASGQNSDTLNQSASASASTPALMSKFSSSNWSVPTQKSEAPLLQKTRTSSIKGKGISKGGEDIMPSGWHVWFYGNGPRLIFWQVRPDQQTVGVELEMSAFLSLLFNKLSSDKSAQIPGVMQLIGADGRSILHQWGHGDIKRVRGSMAQRECALPLTMWRFNYRPSREEMPTSLEAVPILLGSGGACLALLAVAFLFHRESTRARREAEKRVSFVNQVSHELKTPLTNIQLYTEMAQQQAEHGENETLQRHLHVVEAETSRLSRLIHNVLTFARQQRHQLTVNKQQVIVDDLMQRIVSTWKPCLEAKNFEVHLQTNAPNEITADPDALEQIIGNLLSNAEKYAAEGRYICITTNQEKHHTFITVEDRGPGIPKDLQEKIFAPFVRARHDLKEGVSGTGIGLSISRELARLHGGTLTATDLPQGMRFVLTLPTSH